jgi:hypothetical protein
MSITCSSMLACPTCGPNCNYECQSGICVEVPRDDNRVSNVSKTRGVPSMGSTNYGPRGQRQAFRSFQGGGQIPLNNQVQWANNGLNNQVFVGANGNETHTMPDGTIMQGASHSGGYGSIFSEKNYWIGVVAGVVGLMAYQKYIK